MIGYIAGLIVGTLLTLFVMALTPTIYHVLMILIVATISYLAVSVAAMSLTGRQI